MIFFRKLATVLVNRGTLRKGSLIIAGTGWGKVCLIIFNIRFLNPFTPIDCFGSILAQESDSIMDFDILMCRLTA